MNLLQQPKLFLTSVPEIDAENESAASLEIASSFTPLSSNPRENHLLHPLSNLENYASRKIGRQEQLSFHYQQQQLRTGHRQSFMRRLSAALPSLSTDSIPFAAVSSLLP
uniref:Uncharacterized protein n=1 Tax=Setaria digitata TaxID=48799 RepID=A0A915PWE9_9BILA